MGNDENETLENNVVKEGILKRAGNKIGSALDSVKSSAQNVNKKKALIVSGVIVGTLAVVYFSGAAYYSDHFLEGTEIGTFDCSNMTAEEARAAIQKDIDNYSFTFYEKDGSEEVIKGYEIHFECTPVKDLTPLIEQQNAFAWPGGTDSLSLPLDVEVRFSKDALYNRITQMNFMKTTRENMEGSFAKIKYENGEYTASDDGSGKDIVSVNAMYEKLKPKIEKLYKGMSMEKESCYGGIDNDDTMRGVLNALNKYVSAKITYKNGGKSTVLDKDTINEWLSVGEDYSVNIDAEKARAYVDNLAKGYDSVGKERTFKTTDSGEIKISGGSYGWLVNNQKETEALLENIRNGETIEREPVYRQTAAAHSANDLANTYVEVSIAKQHVWFYKDGNLVISTDCVTGNPYKDNSTHKGVYYVVYKDKNVVLKGQGYETPVSFWMPFNGGEGLHDATWRGAFGGNIYQGGGSHGCVNLPYSAAETIYQSITPGDPVVVY